MCADIAATKIFSIALAGGTTPMNAYKQLIDNPARYPIEWSRVQLLLSDERLVPANHPDSNQGQIQPIFSHTDAQCIWPDVSFAMPALTAQAYEQVIFERVPSVNKIPQLDILLLGIGPDGHTASIFPDSQELISPSERLVMPVTNAPKPPPNRISFTLRLINASKHILVLATGEQKAPVVKAVLTQEKSALAYPIAHVKPDQGSVLWIVDESAASQLPQSVL